MIGGGGQSLDARIHVYDGRLWVDRGGGGGGGGSEDDYNDETGTTVVSPSSTGSGDVTTEDRTNKNPASSSSSSSTTGVVSTTATMSQLLVDKAQMFHSGRYVCSALGASGTWTLVHILAGKIGLDFLLFLFDIYFLKTRPSFSV